MLTVYKDKESPEASVACPDGRPGWEPLASVYVGQNTISLSLTDKPVFNSCKVIVVLVVFLSVLGNDPRTSYTLTGFSITKLQPQLLFYVLF